MIKTKEEIQENEINEEREARADLIRKYGDE